MVDPRKLDTNIEEMEFSDTEMVLDLPFSENMTNFANRPDSATSNSDSNTSVHSSEAKAVWMDSQSPLDPDVQRGYIEISDSDSDGSADGSDKSKPDSPKASTSKAFVTPSKTRDNTPETSPRPSTSKAKHTPSKKTPGPLSMDFDDPQVRS